MQKFADLHGMSFIEASARHNLYVAEVFRTLAQQMCELKMQRQPIAFQTDPFPSIIPTLDDNTAQNNNTKSSGCNC